jgi:hypothetical protein
MTCALLGAAAVSGVHSSAHSDSQIVKQAALVASGVRVDLFQLDAVADPALVGLAEAALSRMELALGRPLDTQTLGARVRIYVARATRVSHVWRGYEHPTDPQAALFLTPQVATLALAGTNATYAHELAHLLTWRFHSHTLREGLADYLALQIHPGAGVGPNKLGGAPAPLLSAEICRYLGTTEAPPDALMTDPEFRRAYYYASYRFVDFLIRRGGMQTFLSLYDAAEPEHAFPKLYAVRREDLLLFAKLPR